jgi:putative peptidoglycan lipid II flippase
MTFSKERTNHLIRSTGILMTAFLVNKILALGQRIIVANIFGTSSHYDAYVAAFRLPEILFLLIVGGALGTAFIPILSERLTRRPPTDPDGWYLTSGVLNTTLLVVTGLAALGAVVALPLVKNIVAPGFTPENQILTANLMRLALISTIIFSVSSLVGAVLNTRQHFVLPAIAPLVYNVGIIFGALFLAPHFGIYGLTFGALLGALGHLLIQIPGLIHFRAKFYALLYWRDPDLRRVLKLMGPRVLNVGVIQINFVVIYMLASYLSEGSVSALDYGWDLMQMPQTIIGSAIGIVLFPTLAELAAQHNIAGLRHTMALTVRIMLALTIPAAVGLIVLGRPIIQVMFERGEFGPDSTAAVFWALQFWALALIGHSLLEVVNRTFYAQKDTVTPLLTSLVSMGINLGLALLLYQTVLGVGGLALSNGVAVTIEVLIMLFIANRRLHGVESREIINTLVRTLLAAGAMALAVLAITFMIGPGQPIITIVGGGMLGLAVYLGAGWLLRLEELRLLPRLLGK